MRIFQPTVTGSNTTTGSLHISGPVYFYTLETSSVFHILTYNTSSGQVFFTGSDAFKGVPDDPLNSIQFNHSGSFSGSANLTFDNNVVYLTGSLNTSGSITLTGSMFVSGAISASFGPNTVGFYGTASWAQSASNALFSQTASFITGAGVFGPFGSNSILSASYASSSTSASFAETSSFTFSASFAATAAAAPEDTWIQYNKEGLFGAEQYFRYIYNSHSLQQGNNVNASGYWSHAQGSSSLAYGTASHVEGWKNTASGDYSHAEGESNKVFGNGSHVEGRLNYISESSRWSHVGGLQNSASGWYQTIFGQNNKPILSQSAFIIGGDSYSAPPSARWNMFIAIPKTIIIDPANSATPSDSIIEMRADTASISASYLYLNNLPSSPELNVLVYNTSSGQVYYTASNAIGGGGSGTPTPPAPSDTYIQYNSGGLFGAEQYFRYIYPSHSLQQGYETTALGDWSHAEGYQTFASGAYSHAEGGYSYIVDTRFGPQIVLVSGGKALGNGSHAEGGDTLALGIGSHAEGCQVTASGFSSHAEGLDTNAGGPYSHAEGEGTLAKGDSSHAEGFYNTASGAYQLVIGQYNIANDSQSAFIIGDGTANNARHNVLFVSKSWFEVSASNVFLQGLPTSPELNVLVYNTSSGQVYYTASNTIGGGGSGTPTPPAPSDTYIQYNSGSSFSATGSFRFIYTSQSFQQGYDTIASGSYSHAQGSGSLASGDYSHAEGRETTSLGEYSHAEGRASKAIGLGSHAEGLLTNAIGGFSHAEGRFTSSSGAYSHAEGINSKAEGEYSHAEGSGWALGDRSHAEGYQTTSSGWYSHAEGFSSEAYGTSSHAEGYNTLAYGEYSHAEGYLTTATGTGSHAEGLATSASGDYQLVVGQYNVASTSQSAFIIGDGINVSRRNLLFASRSWFEVSASNVFLQGLPTSPETNILVYNTSSGQVYFTASSAVGGSTFNSTSSVIGNGLSSSFNINHGFNTRNLHITVYESGSNGETVYPDIRRINANTASIIFANPPTSLQYIVYISQ